MRCGAIEAANEKTLLMATHLAGVVGSRKE